MKEINLVEHAQKGNQEAFVQLINAYKEPLYRTAFAFLKNEQDALEAVQEVTYRAYLHIGKLKNPAYVKTWLIRIMMNYCQDQLKLRKRAIHTDQIENLQIYYDASSLEVEEALTTLGENCQRIIHLKYFWDLKNKEIADMESIPEGTVKSRMHKCIQKLRTFWGRN